MLTYYIVQRGDTFYSIAAKFGTTVCVIARLNNMDETDALRVGQKLLVPVNNWRAPSWWQDGMMLFKKLTREQMRLLMDEENCTRMPRRRTPAAETYAPADDYFDENNTLENDYPVYQQETEYNEETFDQFQTETYQESDFFDMQTEMEEEPVTPSSAAPVLNYTQENYTQEVALQEQEQSVSTAAQPAKPDMPNINCQYYTIAAGDTLANIARKYNTTAFILQTVNKIRDVRNLQIGMMICIPKTPKNSYIYTIRSGDTINKIASKFGINADRLIKDNYLNPVLPLMPGNQLLIIV